ncbi:hypothetical protein [cf. Phormidesmis sp. LEGE 11477]|uniref:hypothetical protein n=1 Tax=cf. Phormidesmis sp. LEGE 11477 TaxID=1828680 RepID=UPI0018829E4E|nr:hypothetical protein [cf. Phormidesmis sp. LEGE 11477]MBE9061212.1 hypothetical protein [cf. Phormidesmis sp. LEGE 11477]
MIQTIKAKATVQPGGLVEVHSDELPEGATVEVIVLVEAASEEPKKPLKNLSDFIGAAKGSFSSVAEIDAYIRQERDSWD